MISGSLYGAFGGENLNGESGRESEEERQTDRRVERRDEKPGGGG